MSRTILKKLQLHLDPTYSAEIVKYWKIKEQDKLTFKFQSSQLKKRSELVTWLKKISIKLSISNITLHLAVYLMDYFMDNYSITSDRLSFVGLVCLMLAAKFEELDMRIPRISELSVFNDERYPKTDFVLLECMIFRFFNWSLSQPTVAHFAEYYAIKAVTVDDVAKFPNYKGLHISAYNLLNNYLNASLYEVSLLLYKPSMVAASCIYAIRQTLNLQPTWTSSLIVHTGYEEDDLDECSTLLISRLKKIEQNNLKRKLDCSDEGYSS